MFLKMLLILLVVDFLSDFSCGQTETKYFRDDYHYIEAVESFYKLHMTEQNLADAIQVCTLEGTTLYYPENKVEADAVLEFWKRTDNSGGNLLLGLTDSKIEGQFETIDGKLISEVYVNWLSEEPNDKQGSEDCVELKPLGGFNDESCEKKYRFICKKTLKSLVFDYSCKMTDFDFLDPADKKFFRKDYKYLEGVDSFYKIHTTPTNWRDAKLACAEEGASLFYPENSDEVDAVIPFWKQCQNYTRPSDVWVFVGISDIITEGTLETVDGKSISEVYNHWKINQPDNSGDEDCVRLNQEGKLDDVKCDAKYSFICKKRSPERGCIHKPNFNGQGDKKVFRTDYNYIEATDSFYKLHTTIRNWRDANLVCTQEGASLFFAENVDEANAVVSYWKLNQHSASPDNTWMFVGITDILEEGDFKTIDGNPISEVYSNWRPYQPDGGSYENCLHMNQEGQIKDYYCDREFSFICKKTAPPPERNCTSDIGKSTSGDHIDRKFFRKDYNYIEEVDSFYKIHMTPQTFADAKRMCALEGASLFYAEDADEADAVIEFWNNTHPRSDWTVFVGLTDIMTEGAFETIDGKPISEVYNNWRLGEPNSHNGEEDCVELYRQGYLNDKSCDVQFRFICKKSFKTIEWNHNCNMSDLEYTFDKSMGKCYKVHSTPLNWTDAYAVCLSEESYLAVINNQLEANFLVNLTETAPKRRVGGSFQRGIYHLGFHNRFNNGWQTIKGTPIKVDGGGWWDDFIPTNDEHMQCGSMFFNGLLNNVDCNTKSFFICQHEIDK